MAFIFSWSSLRKHHVVSMLRLFGEQNKTGKEKDHIKFFCVALLPVCLSALCPCWPGHTSSMGLANRKLSPFMPRLMVPPRMIVPATGYFWTDQEICP